MTDAISTSTTAVSAASSRVAPPAPTAQPVTVQEKKTTVENKPLSPRMVSDPVSGVMITEYYNSNGDLAAQLPSAAAVAYLRQGMTESGALLPTATGEVVA